MGHLLEGDAKTQQENGTCGHVELCLESFEWLVLLEVIELMGDWRTQERVSGTHTCPVLLHSRSEDGFLLGEVDSGKEASSYDVSE